MQQVFARKNMIMLLFKESKIPILKYQINSWWWLSREYKKITIMNLFTKENKEKPFKQRTKAAD
ncbi:hypothetical protein [Spiroplasma poulsonii]|uniref:hypothetical protein n=1 Tax=Spiroplasma poulsonii TaxID=2138 RepID=UPI001F4C8F5E|nr:hypothetical protein [Spiroplasma poulsonii]UNF62093.1 hypothetical protein MNU24_01105 [Spiroplasma poulsonii]